MRSVLISQPCVVRVIEPWLPASVICVSQGSVLLDQAWTSIIAEENAGVQQVVNFVSLFYVKTFFKNQKHKEK